MLGCDTVKKITFFIYNMFTDGGTEKAVSLIANNLSNDYEIEIVSLYKNKSNPFYNLNSNIKLINILEEGAPIYKIYSPILYYKVAKSLRNYKTDCFIASNMNYIPLTLFMKRRAKYIVWEHYSSAIITKKRYGYWVRKLASKLADKIVVLTESDRKENIKKFGTLPTKIKTIYNPIEMKENKQPYDEKSKRIISVGRLVSIKGFDMLIDVATKVFAKHPDWEWHIYGEGSLKDELQKKIEENNMQNNLKLMGRTDKLLELYKEYAMFVLTSRNEGLGMVNIEAHCAHLPIVSFNCPFGPAEIIKEDVNGYLIKCFDIDEMANKINFLIENTEKRIEMSKNTMLDKEKFKMSNVIKEWKEILISKM